MTAPDLGFYSLNGDPRWACAPGRWVKIQEAQWIAAAKAAGALVYYRPFLSGDDGGVADAHAWAHDVWTSIVATGGTQPDALVFRNEIWATEQTGRDYATFYRDLRAAGYTGLIVLGSFADGEPDFPPGTTGGNWDELKAGLGGLVPDAYDVHCYFEDDPQGDTWHSLRHLQAIQRGYLPATARLFAGELGQTDGWIKKGWTAEEYAARLLRWRDLAGSQMEAAFVFADDDTSGEWRDYPIRGTAADAAVRMTWQGGPAVSLKGLDVSSFQPNTDWGKVAAAGYAFAFVKATEGTGYANPQFARDWSATKAAGLIRGAYHFARPDANPNGWAAEADHFLATVGTLEPGDLLALDLEVGAGDLSGWANNWYSRAITAAGFRPIFYSYGPFIAEHDLGGLSRNPLWLAAYQQGWPQTPAGWPAIAIWQHTSGATVPGVSGQCDENYTPLDAASLRALGKGGSPVDPLTQRAKANYELLGVGMNPATALSQAYVAWYAMWEAAGKPDASNKGPALHPEAGDAQDGYLALDDGSIFHAHNGGAAGWHVAAAEYKEHAAIRQRFGW